MKYNISKRVITTLLVLLTIDSLFIAKAVYDQFNQSKVSLDELHSQLSKTTVDAKKFINKDPKIDLEESDYSKIDTISKDIKFKSPEECNIKGEPSKNPIDNMKTVSIAVNCQAIIKTHIKSLDENVKHSSDLAINNNRDKLSTQISQAKEALADSTDKIKDEELINQTQDEITVSQKLIDQNESDFVKLRQKIAILSEKKTLISDKKTQAEKEKEQKEKSAAAKSYAKLAARQTKPKTVNPPATAPPISVQTPGIRFFNQGDNAWRNAQVGNWRFGPSGCVPTSIAMVMHLFGNYMSPLDWGYNLHNRGLFNNGAVGGNSDSILDAAAQGGLWRKPIYNAADLNKHLELGYPVIALIRPPLTIPGTTHAIVLNGFSNGNTQILDPNGGRVNGWRNINEVFSAASDDPFDYGSTGSAFIAIGRSAPTPPKPETPPSNTEPIDPPKTESDSNPQV